MAFCDRAGFDQEIEMHMRRRARKAYRSSGKFEWLCICYEYIRTERERKTDPEKNRYQDFGRSISGISRSRERRGNGITKGMVKIPCANGTLHGSLWVPRVGGADRYNVLQVIESMKCSHSSASVEHFT